MNDMYSALRELVPMGDKAHKEGILEDTVAYLRALRHAQQTQNPPVKFTGVNIVLPAAAYT